ncbi:copper chaperone PCu(A)C [Methylosinus sp. H3A]|uniref:copper chaperone PCu(A)C n=1 Tax=Methylosinus sp. H3A TaxID=2785786 RepID=UPI0018C1DCD7|nr:copper chaperone PCu(A)C [Methylosinus sp. H3A]MBG0810525.1 copper chaperone PCu(A)C [Methylosinus sp. H3A]
MLLFATATLAAPAAIVVERAWCAPPPKGVTTGACYLALRNGGPTEDRLLGVEAEAAHRVEMHVTKISDGVGRMRPLADGVALPAESLVDFREKGYHLMLVDLRGPLAEGETVRGTLRFEHAGARPVLFHVERPHTP